MSQVPNAQGQILGEGTNVLNTCHCRRTNWKKTIIIVALINTGFLVCIDIFFLNTRSVKGYYETLVISHSTISKLSRLKSNKFPQAAAAPNFNQGNILQESTLVFVCLGKDCFTKHQKYIWKALEQARLVEVNLPIVVILNSDQPGIVQKQLNRLNVTSVTYEDLLINSSMLMSEFRRAFFVQGPMVPDGNKNFVQYAIERLLTLHAYMNMTRRLNVFHLENDNMLYMNLSDLLSRMQACHVRLAFPKAASHRAITSFVYSRSSHDLEHFVRYVIQIFRLGRTEAIKLLKTSWINDMTIGAHYLSLYAATAEQSKLDGIFELPSQFTSDSCLNGSPAKTQIIFDSCVLGQYFGGRYSRPEIPFWDSTHTLDPRGHLLIWKKLDHRRRVPFILGFRIVNIHVHSKHLEQFSSVAKDPPTGIGFKSRIA